MNFLGLGVGELLLILVIAMLVVGPERMVEFAGQMGRLLAKFREQSDSITREFKEAFTLELEEGDEPSEGKGAKGAGAPAAKGTAAQALPADNVSAPNGDSAEEAPPEEPRLSPEEVAALEALELAQRLASDMVDGEVEVALTEVGTGDNGVEAEGEPYEEVEPIDLQLASIVPEDEDVEPTTVNDVLVIPDDGDVSAELPMEAEE